MAGGGWNSVVFKVPSNSNHSLILKKGKHLLSSSIVSSLQAVCFEPGRDAMVLTQPSRGGARAVTGRTGHCFPSCQPQVWTFLSSSTQGNDRLVSCCCSWQLLPMTTPKAAGLTYPWCMACHSHVGDVEAHHPTDCTQHSSWPAPKIKVFISLSKQIHKNAPLWDCN